MHIFWLLPNLRPVLLTYIFVDLDISAVKGIPSVFVTARDPIFFASLAVGVICFESASGERVKSPSLVVNGLAALRECNPADSGRACQSVFPLNPHYSGDIHIL